MLRDEVAQLQPQRVLALALQGTERVVVQHLSQPAGGLAPQALSKQEARARWGGVVHAKRTEWRSW